MPFVKTEVDIKPDYTVGTLAPERLKQGARSPKHLMLDPAPRTRLRDRLPRPPSPGELFDKTRETELWKSVFRPGSIFRKGYKDTQRDRALAMMNNVLYHLHPVKIKRHGLKLTYTFCLGGLSFFLFILLTIT